MENIRRPAPDIFHTSDLIYDNHMEEAFFRCNELPLPTLSYLSTPSPHMFVSERSVREA